MNAVIITKPRERIIEAEADIMADNPLISRSFFLTQRHEVHKGRFDFSTPP